MEKYRIKEEYRHLVNDWDNVWYKDDLIKDGYYYELSKELSQESTNIALSGKTRISTRYPSEMFEKVEERVRIRLIHKDPYIYREDLKPFKLKEIDLINKALNGELVDKDVYLQYLKDLGVVDSDIAHIDGHDLGEIRKECIKQYNKDTMENQSCYVNATVEDWDKAKKEGQIHVWNAETEQMEWVDAVKHETYTKDQAIKMFGDWVVTLMEILL